MLTAAMLAAFALPVRYEFVPDTDRRVAIRRPDALIMGELDADGDFMESHKLSWPPGGTLAYTGPSFERLGGFATYPRDVYEFRSGMLIPGKMVRQSVFVPDDGGRVTKFADYVYAPTARPIWNLPGSFRPVGSPRNQWTRNTNGRYTPLQSPP